MSEMLAVIENRTLTKNPINNIIVKNYIKYLVLALLLLGCKNYKSLTTQIDKNKAIPYNQYSQEFQAWEATKNIKLEDAYQKHLSYAAKNQDKIKLKSTKGYPLYYVYDDYYIFSTVTYIHKIGILIVRAFGSMQIREKLIMLKSIKTKIFIQTRIFG